MNLNYLIFKKYLYLFLILFSLNSFFLSTNSAFSKNLIIENIEISKNFDEKFDRNKVINEGFNLAFEEIVFKIVQSKDQKKINNLSLANIKLLIENFSIKEEKFLNNKYHVSLDVEFNKRKIFNLFEQKNIFPSLPNKKKVMFIPILVDEEKNDLILFSENEFYIHWIDENDKKDLIEYVLPNEDLEDINLIRERYDELENYNFEEIINKYSLDSYIISLFYKNFNSQKELKNIIRETKIIFNDLWKKENQVNTSIKLPLIISVDLNENKKIRTFENIIENLDLVSNLYISKIDNKKIYYTLIYNGTPKAFISNIEDAGYQLDFSKKIWDFK